MSFLLLLLGCMWQSHGLTDEDYARQSIRGFGIPRGPLPLIVGIGSVVEGRPASS